MVLRIAFLFLGIVAWFTAGAGPERKFIPRVELKRVPDSGIQPQVATDSDGSVHLVYFKGDASGGDLYYARSKDGNAFSSAIRVNSVAGSAVAMGNIRGARVAIGRAGRVYVAWNGSQKAAEKNGGRAPMLFARLNTQGTGFEPERNVIQSAYGIDGGGGIAADSSGRVYVFWHAPKLGKDDEQSRVVWVTRSPDDGSTFEPERIAWSEPSGACGCCSLNAFTDSKGAIYVLFRSARETVNRDMYLLVSKDHGATFAGSDISPWKVGYCVMSSEAFAMNSQRVFAAWETEKKIRFGAFEGNGSSVFGPMPLGAGKNEKYPSLAVNGKSDVLVAWTDGMAWKHGGSLHWQLLDGSGERLGTEGAGDGVPVWSLVGSYSRRDGSFVILY